MRRSVHLSNAKKLFDFPDHFILCGSGTPKKLSRSNYSYHVAVTNDAAGPREIKVIYTDGDFVGYKIPENESFSLSQAAGSNQFDRAIRVVGTPVGGKSDLSGAVSAKGHIPFCISCDGVLGDAACDALISD